ncbi:ATP-dependent DNA helicase RecG [Candidatus Margulisiibacteriota bacterium]
MTTALDKSIQYLKGVGPKLAKILAKVGIQNLRDLLYYFPRNYDDRRRLPKISTLYKQLGEIVCVRGRIVTLSSFKTRSRLAIVKANIIDDTAKLTVVWFNQPFLNRILKKGMEVFVRGKVEKVSVRGYLQLSCQEYEIIKGHDSLSMERVVPIYPLTIGLYQKKIRALAWYVIKNCLKDLLDPFEDTLRKENNLLWLSKAVEELHFPENRRAWKAAHDRIVFDEFYYLQLRAALQGYYRQGVLKSKPLKAEGELIEAWKKALPFKLTSAQQRVLGEIKEDLQKDKPMSRLLQGDVGSGKTEVGLAAMLMAVQSGKQAAFMVPTEILAEQHFYKLSKRMEELGVKVVYRVGNMKKKAREQVDKQIKTGVGQIVIGTHALIQDKVEFKDLGLVVIDEQHRFGVGQRQALVKKGRAPHTLVMTATPIPRTLALTFYGDLDKSIIDELPPGRKAITTKWVQKAKLSAMYDYAKKEIAAGKQIYIVYPLVQETEKNDLKAATESSQYLAEKIFTQSKVQLIHGKLKSSEKESIMRDFRAGQTDVLVATTVIEVGVDVPQASIMIIEHAERFGLAQLHQLRGRVGRGQDQSYCFLVGNPKTAEGKQRLEAMVSTTDGFKLAEIDLKLRGPGEFYGFRQSGIPDLNVADLVKDEPILQKARALAYKIVAEDNVLSRPEHYEMKKEIKRKFGNIFDWQVLN